MSKVSPADYILHRRGMNMLQCWQNLKEYLECLKRTAQVESVPVYMK